MEAFRGKASGKTAEEKLSDNVLFAQTVYAAEARAEKAEARIAELEAELADHDQMLTDQVIHYKARAEKAEAEIERLNEDLLDSRHWPHVVENIYDPACVRCARRGRPPALPPVPGG